MLLFAGDTQLTDEMLWNLAKEYSNRSDLMTLASKLDVSGYRHTTSSLICMSTHKATAARCLSYHQATSGHLPRPI